MISRLLIVYLIFSFFGHSQSKIKPEAFTLIGGKTFSSFIFKNSENINEHKFNYTDGSAFGLNMSFRWKARNMIRPEIIWNQAGAESLYGGNTLVWKMNYASVNIGYLYKIIDKENLYRFTLNAGLALGFDYLMNGSQTINKVSYDLKETNAFKSWDLKTSILLNAKYNITPSFYAGIEYRFGIGLNQIEREDSQYGQKTRNIGHLAGLNLGFNL